MIMSRIGEWKFSLRYANTYWSLNLSVLNRLPEEADMAIF